jgi:nicotinate-nucleotide--dimethylbenzimidazole phosphoribosyltransferase
MKLSPPASSSDLEAAREIARRLHQHRRREDRPSTEPRTAGPQDAGSFVASSPPAAATPVEAPPPAPLEPPEWDEPGGPDAPALDALDALAGFGEAQAPEEPPADADPDVDVDVDVHDLGVEEPAVSPEEMVGIPEPPPLEDLTAGEPVPPSPFDVDLDEAPPDEMVEIPTAPSWDEVVVACLDVSKARGAMLIDPAGQVFAARGEWPEPGPDAIATKLVSTLSRTLKDAPTRSISAPLLGKHLTAWRVPLAEGLVTAAFIGDSPVRAEARPAIDAEIHRGPGA